MRLVSLPGLGRQVLDLLLPPLCPLCGALVAEPGTLCPACWGAVEFLAPPLCERCGVPFPFDAGEGLECGACATQAPPWRRARAVVRYDENSRRLALALKHADRTDLAPALGRWMARAGAELLAEADLVAPVPLHWFRLWRRRYNQAALLAWVAARAAAKPVLMDLLVRRRPTPALGGLGRDERARAVRGAFALHRRHGDRVAGRAVLLIDDVLTSGATAGECARVLLKAGAKAVDVLTLARVTRDG